MKEVKIFLGSDHAGFAVKEKVKAYLEKKNFQVQDLSAKCKPGDDYTDVSYKLAKKVATSNTKGILICGSGVGVCMAANKIKGIRAVSAYDSYTSKMSRNDEDSNILCLRARGFPFAKTLPILSTWLKTPFSNLPRHSRRIKKLNSK